MKKILSFLLFYLVIALFFLWLIFDDFHLLIWSVVLLNIQNMLFSFINIRKRGYFLFINITIFLFLLSRPFIDMLGSYKLVNYDEKTGSIALLLIGLSLLSLFSGVLIHEKLFKEKDFKNNFFTYTDSNFIKNLQRVSIILFFLCLIFNFMEGFEKIIFIQNSSYYDFYVEYNSRLPFFVKGFSEMVPTFLAIYLCTLPSKKQTSFVLFIYTLSTIPSLIVGSRTSFSEALVFTFLYFLMRDSLNYRASMVGLDKYKKWITRSLKISIITIIPVIMILFSAYNYVRFEIEKTNDMNPIVDFVYNQGISFTTLTRGYTAAPYLPDHDNKNYTFGSFIDYITRGTPSQILFGVEGLGSNTVEHATLGNSLSHALSYHLYGKSYLNGQGAGSSYILELYLDFGLIGIVIFSILLGILFSSFSNLIGNNWFKNVILLRILMEVFLIPRGSALGWLNFLMGLQFWIPIFLCWFLSLAILSKQKKHVYRKSSLSY
ncbi:O-antigen polysaccharide polymerase Wzy family protein [Bacillus timonensis]|uniref:O-antigen polysaccharide polymerase Wzy family protein n=1 Tax=Bacillus timonensis TaxID=1033734 RepID=UPI0002887C25|nr:O-antigen polysaccharide polymerase Wzy family protein [Bacillus timonensis]